MIADYWRTSWGKIIKTCCTKEREIIHTHTPLLVPTSAVAACLLCVCVLGESLVAWTLPLCTASLTRQQLHRAAGAAATWLPALSLDLHAAQSDLYASERQLYSSRVLHEENVKARGNLCVNSISQSLTGCCWEENLIWRSPVSTVSQSLCEGSVPLCVFSHRRNAVLLFFPLLLFSAQANKLYWLSDSVTLLMELFGVAARTRFTHNVCSNVFQHFSFGGCVWRCSRSRLIRCLQKITSE